MEPGGGARSIAAGVRVVTLPGGAVLTSDDRLPMALDAPLVVPLPERLGGGFLIKVEDRTIWRAEKWLGPARPIFTSRTSPRTATIARVVAGLDRVYALAGGMARLRRRDGRAEGARTMADVADDRRLRRGGRLESARDRRPAGGGRDGRRRGDVALARAADRRRATSR